MSVEEFAAMIHGYIRDEFVALSEIKNNVIHVRFVDGTLIKVNITYWYEKYPRLIQGYFFIFKKFNPKLLIVNC